MNESFDLSFFAHKTSDAKRVKAGIEEIFGVEDMCLMPPQKSCFPLLDQRERCYEYYEEEDFVAYWIGIGDICITRHNLPELRDSLLRVVDECFTRFPSIQFATGIYELTAYYLGDVTKYNEFTYDRLNKFPFLFLREKNQFGFSAQERYHDVWLVTSHGKEVQDVFSDMHK